MSRINKEIILQSGKQRQSFSVPEKNLAWVISPGDLPVITDVADEVRRALKNPIGSPGLEGLVKEEGKKVVLLVDDMTRSTPQKVILPVIVEELNRIGVSDEEITALICLGTHRPMTEKEIKDRYGEETVKRIKFINHDCRDKNQLVEINNTYSSTQILVNKLYYESDVSIAIGNIIPHMYAGWAGGSKMIQPGICGAATTGETHLMAAENVHEILGTVDNPVRKEIENIARLTGLTMIVNTVLNARHEVVKVVAGDPVQAHREGVKIGEEIYRVDLEDYCDLVVASSYPADLDLWQSIKALNNCSMAVKPGGGRLVLFADDPEGIAPDHPDLVSLGVRDAEEAKAAYENGEVTDKVALATYLAMNLNRKRVKIVLVSSGISKEEATRIGFEWAPDLETAVTEGLAEAGLDSKIGVVTHGADMFFKVSVDK